MKTTIQDAIFYQEKINCEVLAANIEKSLVSMSYPPLIENGGNYSLCPVKAQSSKEPTSSGSDTIGSSQSLEKRNNDLMVCSFGQKAGDLCTTIARTLLINPFKQQTTQLRSLLDIRQHAISLLQVV
jgi:hypothetical protein